MLLTPLANGRVHQLDKVVNTFAKVEDPYSRSTFHQANATTFTFHIASHLLLPIGSPHMVHDLLGMRERMGQKVSSHPLPA